MKKVIDDTRRKIKIASEKKKDRGEYLKSYRKSYTERTKRVSLTFTTKEYQELIKLSQKAHKPVTSYVKDMFVANKTPRQILTQEELEVFRDTLIQLRAVGNNINQIAKHSNIIKKVSQTQRAINELKSLEQILTKLLSGR